MWLVLYLLLYVLYPFYEFIVYGLENSRESTQRFFDRIVVRCGDYLFPVKHLIHEEKKDNHIKVYPRIVLLVCNHVNLLDFLLVNRFLCHVFPGHRYHYVMGAFAIQSFSKLWDFIGHDHVSITDFQEPSLLENKIRRWIEDSDSHVIILFPEGKLMTAKSMRASLSRSEALHQLPFRQCLFPYTKGFHVLTSILRSSRKRFEMIDATLIYPFDHDCLRYTQVSHLLTLSWTIPRHVQWHLKEMDSTDIISLWRKKDELLCQASRLS